MPPNGQGDPADGWNRKEPGPPPSRARITTPGPSTIRTELEQPARGEDLVRIAVEDDGRGIPEELLEHVFEPFFTTKGEGGGTGLGLPMVYGIAIQHGGTVSVTSRPGEGTRFEVRLPASDRARELEAAEATGC